MSLKRSHITAISAWLFILMVVLAIEILLGVEITTTQVLALVVMGVAPAVVLVVVFRGAPQSMGQLLYETDHAKDPKASDKSSTR
jgi:hypothetical protein